MQALPGQNPGQPLRRDGIVSGAASQACEDLRGGWTLSRDRLFQAVQTGQRDDLPGLRRDAGLVGSMRLQGQTAEPSASTMIKSARANSADMGRLGAASLPWAPAVPMQI